MATSEYKIAPGWLGNLTDEQEAKLKELWEKLAAISGIETGKTPADVSLQRNSTSASGDLSSVYGDKKKRRFGIGRKTTDSGEADDKYGQTKDFKKALANMTPEQLRTSFWSFSKADDPDALLLRFLRARKWNVQNALVMMVSTVHWRGQEIHLDDELIFTGEEGMAQAEHSENPHERKLGADFMAQLRLGKSFCHGTDRQGRPMNLVRVRLHHGGEQSDEALERYTVYSIETTRLMLRPPVETACIIFDLTGFSMANMDYTPLKFMIKCFEANYPESLGIVLVYRAPWIFGQVWKIIKPMLDPVVAAKVQFAKSAKELEEWIPPHHIPKELGGEEDFEYYYPEPEPGENPGLANAAMREKLWEERWAMVEEYEKATLSWGLYNGGEPAQRRRKELVEQMKVNYWKMDPYIRAKSYYDRVGMIRGNGIVQMYPNEAPEMPVNGQVNGVSIPEPSQAGINASKIPARRDSMDGAGDDYYFDAVEYQHRA